MSTPRAALAPAAVSGSRTSRRSSSPSPLHRVAAALTALVLGTGLALVGIAAPASAGGEGNEGKVCANLDTGHKSDAVGASFTIEAPEGKLIAEVCVKAGSDNQGDGPVSTTYDPPVASVIISHPSGKDISHYSVRYVDVPVEPEVVKVEVEPTSVDPCGTANDSYSQPSDTTAITWSVTGSVQSGTVVLTAATKLGFVFEAGAQKVWTFTFTNVPCEEEPEVIVIEIVPTSIDLCGTIDDGFTAPTDTTRIDWTVDGTVASGKVVVSAVAAAGYKFADGAKTSWTFEFTDDPCEVEPKDPTLEGSFATGTCVADSPWITFDVKLTDPDKQSTGNTASLVLTDGVNTETIKLGELENGSLKGEVLWPGASVDEDGTANGWPGWALVGDKWVETDGNFAWTRGAITAKLVVNPEVPVTISYPKATPECATGPTTTPPGGGEGGTTTSHDGAGLASTGFAGTSIAIAAGAIVIAGLAFLVVARLRRKSA
ncbi:hypothetical protein JOE59_001785 [Agromyces cerinus]|uniref:hypothetical protein n=1 Tax=Agromyces cerinus TaxID=33878 RepID=UPI001EF7DC3C|nr:hypothetical protein [Agromyces cerinus]MBM7831080.1 hypothetical protein [Agromyces cerinus]